ncbi:hypothetical protein [Puia dinghuensis]|uniref:Uncharacterized protein n=1 Tax=Puia dinghuensis TaxID=1792502 RepID=A0A8J2UD07_9BACT|nr:hypothetical protein [Puia dinghuensis]GGA97846.1 hypothetical protein GCM10011511_21460 [Puia dinghuensis]
MGKYSVNQEVLLIRSTSFLNEELCKKDDARNDSSLFDNERLEEACWNGLLQARLPEIFWDLPGKLFLWQIKEATSFLVLDLGEAPDDMDSHFSIVPYSFVSTQIHN